jgi:large subunit ribosomal protein L30
MSETAKTGRGRKTTAGKKTIVIEQYRSGICCNVTHKRVLRSLGFRRLRQQVVRPDNPSVRGMVATIPHLVRIVEA